MIRFLGVPISTIDCDYCRCHRNRSKASRKITLTDLDHWEGYPYRIQGAGIKGSKGFFESLAEKAQVAANQTVQVLSGHQVKSHW